MIEGAAYYIIEGQEHDVKHAQFITINTQQTFVFFTADGDIIDSFTKNGTLDLAMKLSSMLDPSVKPKPVLWKVQLSKGNFKESSKKYLVFYDKNGFVIDSYLLTDGNKPDLFALDLSLIH